MIREFKTFRTSSNALALAVAVIIGASVGRVLSSIAERGGDGSAILYGHFPGAAADFTIIAGVLFLITHASLLKPGEGVETKTCSPCCDVIPAHALRRRACTAMV